MNPLRLTTAVSRLDTARVDRRVDEDACDDVEDDARVAVDRFAVALRGRALNMARRWTRRGVQWRRPWRLHTQTLDAFAVEETFDIDDAHMAAVTMGKPDKDVLERGFKRHRMRETKPLDDSVEHEGVAEVLGEHEFASAALEDTANLEETENAVEMRKEVKEVFPSVLRLARSFNAGVMIAVRVPAQLLVTFITLVIIPSVYNVQVVCTLFCFWGIVSRYSVTSKTS